MSKGKIQRQFTPNDVKGRLRKKNQHWTNAKGIIASA